MVPQPELRQHQSGAQERRRCDAENDGGCLLWPAILITRVPHRVVACPIPRCALAYNRAVPCRREKTIMAIHKLLLLPGDGIGPEVMAEVKKLHRLDELPRHGHVETEEGLVGGSCYDAHQVSITDAASRGPRRRRHHLRLGRRAEVGQGALRRAARGGPAAAAQGPRALRQSPPCLTYPALADASALKRELVDGLDIIILRELTGGVYFGEPKTITTWATARACGRYAGLRHLRDRTDRTRGVRARPQAQEQSHLDGEAQRHEDRRAVARGDDAASSARVQGRHARAPAGRFRRHAACPQPQAVRRRRHRQPVRRHAVRYRGDADRLTRHVGVGFARRHRSEDARSARRCTSRCTARRPTSPARASPIRSR